MEILEKDHMKATLKLEKEDITQAIDCYLKCKGFRPKIETVDFGYTILDAIVEVDITPTDESQN